jgi:hypothetical protein
MARHLWRSWRVIEAVVLGEAPASWPEVAARTQRRWRARLRSLASILIQLLATSGQRLIEAVAQEAGIRASREKLLSAYVGKIRPRLGSQVGELAALIHRLGRGPRLM